MKNCRPNNYQSGLFAQKRQVFNGPEGGIEAPGERPRYRRRIDVNKYVKKYEETMRFLEGVIDGKAIADMKLTDKQKDELKNKAQRAMREFEGLPDPAQLSNLRDSKAWAGEYYPRIAKIMEKYFDKKKTGGREWLLEHMRKAVHGEAVPDFLLHVSGFHKRRSEAMATIWDIMTRLQKKRFDIDHPFMKILRDAQTEIAETGSRRYGNTKSAGETLEQALSRLPSELEELVDKEKRSYVKTLLAGAAKTYRARLGLPSRAKEEREDQMRIKEEVDKSWRRDAIANAIGRSIDKIEGRYGYAISGKWHDLPGNNPMDKGNPKRLILDVEREIKKIGRPDMTKTKPGEKWEITKQGFTFKVARLPGKKPSYNVEMVDVSKRMGKKFPRMARYVERLEDRMV